MGLFRKKDLRVEQDNDRLAQNAGQFTPAHTASNLRRQWQYNVVALYFHLTLR